ncbi:hypothetical protein HPT25_27950 [Bacillus sp. BRMEA1]|uniref:hypothetical protein n=1 Tax=Neobacillus endophyticus TaxID=2738405 RepID=UPI0015657455|nr:hypothetical protein [Neobacillus endophyticus]NRD81128.1 hypothetical protein [Neobacillus endophyticus]
MQEGLNKRLDVLKKIIDVKKMDIEECEKELSNRYYPVIVRLAITEYILKLQKELESYENKLVDLQSFY